MTRYTLGFLFNMDFSRVVLLRKKRPSWQAGKLNGVGGHIEGLETPRQCMEREFHEEVYHDFGVGWQEYATIGSPDFEVVCFAAQAAYLPTVARGDEPVVVLDVASLSGRNVIENLLWLIPLAIDTLQDGRPNYTRTDYRHLPGDGK